MYWKMIRRDLAASWLTVVTLAAFIVISAMLFASSGKLLITLSSAVDRFMALSRTPHFMQMHQGTLDAERLERFARDNALVEAHQVIEVLNVDAASILINGQSMRQSVEDNAFTTQSPSFDLLLDTANQVIQPQPGEIYLPVAFEAAYDFQVGDPVTVRTAAGEHGFTIAGLLRDSQMNSSFSSSKRLLISAGDYAALKADTGQAEYLIEFRLKDVAQVAALEAAYTAARLEANGPTITYDMFRLVNALSEALTAIIVILVSLLILCIAFLCIHFTLLATLEEEYNQIGVMRAIGFSTRDVNRLYLWKYLVIAALGCVLGAVASFALDPVLTRTIQRTMGAQLNPGLALAVAVGCGALLFGAIALYCRHTLRAFDRVSILNALKDSRPDDSRQSERRSILGAGNTNLRLGLQSLRANRRLFTTLLAVFALATFILVVPTNLSTTIGSPRFVTYMGVGQSDIRFDLTDARHAQSIMERLTTDPRVASVGLFVTASYEMPVDGTVQYLKVESGDPTRFPLDYQQGRAPQNEREIALSALNAEALAAQVGDTLTLVIRGRETPLTVSGIYQDITNGGKTAKARFAADESALLWSVIMVNLVEPSQSDDFVAEYQAAFPVAQVSSVAHYLEQTLAGSIRAVNQAAVLSLAFAVLVSLLIAALFLKLLLARDQPANAVMSAIGFQKRDLSVQYLVQMGAVLLAGIAIGVALAATLGEDLAGVLFAGLGVSSFRFIVNPLFAYGLQPLLPVVAVLITIIVVLRLERPVPISKVMS